MDKIDFQPLILLQNNKPIDDFCGLTATEMHRLLYDQFGIDSPLRLHSNLTDETLDKIPFFCLTEELLNMIQRESSLKLTPKEALSRKTITDLYSRKYIPEYGIENGLWKLTRERDAVSLKTLRGVVSLTGIVKQSKGKIVLTKKGEAIVRMKQRQELFHIVLLTYINKINWGFLDFNPESVGQFGWGFTVFLLLKFGDTERLLQFYADKYMKAFSTLLTAFSHKIFNPPERLFVSCYRSRTFARFLIWFGLITLPLTDGVFGENDMVKQTEVMNKLFTFE